MKLYRIANWNDHYENNRTRELKKLDWVPIPNKQDGDGYTLIMEHANGAAIFGAWIACVQIASRCEPRGTLLRDGAKPHDSASLSRMSRVPEKTIKEMLELLTHGDIKWIEINNLKDECDNLAEGCDNPAIECLEGKGREGKEGKGSKPPPSGFISEVFDAWNAMAEKTGIPRCLIVSDSRRRTIQARERDPFFQENWNVAMDKVSKSNFCRGENDRGWTATFDWFIKPESFTKVVEGKYDNREQKKPAQRPTHIPDATPKGFEVIP